MARMQEFEFRTQNDAGLLIPSSVFSRIDTSSCSFIKCFLALPQQKYKLVRTIATQSLFQSDWITMENNNQEDFSFTDLHQGNIFLKIKLFNLSVSKDKAYAEHTFH